MYTPKDFAVSDDMPAPKKGKPNNGVPWLVFTQVMATFGVFVAIHIWDEFQIAAEKTLIVAAIFEFLFALRLYRNFHREE